MTYCLMTTPDSNEKKKAQSPLEMILFNVVTIVHLKFWKYKSIEMIRKKENEFENNKCWIDSK